MEELTEDAVEHLRAVLYHLEQAVHLAVARGDLDAARRLDALRVPLDAELELTPAGLTRPSLPEGAALGWLLRYDPHVRELRRAHGLSLPDEELGPDQIHPAPVPRHGPPNTERTP